MHPNLWPVRPFHSVAVFPADTENSFLLCAQPVPAASTTARKSRAAAAVRTDLKFWRNVKACTCPSCWSDDSPRLSVGASEDLRARGRRQRAKGGRKGKGQKDVGRSFAFCPLPFVSAVVAVCRHPFDGFRPFDRFLDILINNSIFAVLGGRS